ncbi:hypothetical protein [Sabulibacter ruber]|uniref:hypothetical protein n=1 Tax=Sabulibacter ruber TaxID=2811901 RepID=UPI001A970911|nr:hypothetical protein [Sabulibacter ruber]
MKKILQKQLGGYRKYTIKGDGLYLEVKSHEGFTARLIKFEDIGFDEIITKYVPAPVVISLFVSVFFNLLLLLIFFIDFAERLKLSSGVTSGLTGGVTVCLAIWGKVVFRFEKQKILKGEVSIAFNYFRKKEAQVDEFIQELKASHREYIRKKYMEIDELKPMETQRNIFFWLYENEYIERPELEDLLAKLERKVIVKGF